ncbi:hypothetical protein Q8A73_012215 [Channa argus]|nr:hypothetical protein Q8A73_012215 [Channa argus]
MASALEPLVSGCIFRLVVVSVSHGSGTFFSAARHEIPRQSGVRRDDDRGGGWGVRRGEPRPSYFAPAALSSLHRRLKRYVGGRFEEGGSQRGGDRS